MAKLWRSLLGLDDVTRFTLDQHIANLSSPNAIISYGSSPFRKTEDVENSFTAYCQQLLKSDGVVYACMAARGWLFAEARFAWQELNEGRPGDLFWTPDLEVLEHPWPNATTGEMLIRADQDASLAGSAIIVGEEGPDGPRLRRLQPDWVTVVLTAPPAAAARSDIAGFWYHPGRTYSNIEEPDLERDEVFLPGETCFWTPMPDPEAQFRGMSWLTPVMREVLGDKSATEHKLNFFVNGATLGPIISAKENLTPEQFQDWTTNLNAQHQGVQNAYRPLFLASPVDVNVRGLDLRQLDFKATQGAGETRIAAAARVHPVILGLSEGMQGSSLNAGNYTAAKRNFVDGTMRPLWRSIAASLSNLVGKPDRPARLWYDDRDIAFLRDDRQDVAKIQQAQASTMRQLIDAAFEPESVAAAVNADDWTLLKHTGIPTVQVQNVQPPPEAVSTREGGDDA